jgi:DNA-binding NarL/FixJ family response regulator
MIPGQDIRLLIVDDHPVVRFGLAAIVNSQEGMTVVAQTGSGEEAISLYRQYVPDVVLADLRLPDISGVEVIRRIREEFANGRFVVVTTYQGDEDIHRALTAGAQGYLVKGMSHVVLVNAIRAVHAGLRYIPRDIENALAQRPIKAELSAREREILELVVQGLSNKGISERLGITEGTVKWHINMILSRLNVTDRTQAAITALQRGIVHL